MTTEKSQALKRIEKLFDIKESKIEDTKLFVNVNHQNLIDSFVYWIDQSKLIFGEPVKFLDIQNIKDSGVDIYFELLHSNIQFGIQVKTFGDIQKVDFSQSLSAQISDSHTYPISKFVLAFAGDLTNKSQFQKIRMTISKLLQYKEHDYLLILSPEKVFSIYNCFIKNEHPLKHIMRENKDSLLFAKAIQESLSDDDKEVDVKINIKYKHENSDAPYKINLQYQMGENTLDLQDKVNALPYTGDYVKLTKNQIKDFTVTDKNGNVISKGETEELYIIPEGTPFVMVSLSTISPSNHIISSIGNHILNITRIGNMIKYSSKKNQSIALEFSINLDDNKMESNFHLNFDVQISELMNSINFIESFKEAAYLQIFYPDSEKTQFLKIPQQSAFTIDSAFKELVKNIEFLQSYFRRTFVFSSQYTDKELGIMRYSTSVLLKMIIKEEFILRPIKIKMKTNLAKAMIEDYFNSKIQNDCYINLPTPISILGQNITVPIAILNLKNVKPKDDTGILLDRIKNCNINEDVEFELIDNAQ